MAYQVEGRLLEVCDCNVLCPCWIGEDADNGTCDAIAAWHIDRGEINGIDVSGRTIAALPHIPGNILAGNWKALVVIDDGASQEQQDAMLKVWTGALGGPIADLAKLIGEVVGVERVPVTFLVEGGKGTIKLGGIAEAELVPYQGATGGSTVLQDTVFTTIPGSPAYVGKALSYRRNTSKYGLPDVDLQGHNAIQGTFKFEA
jgi:hypothetical protein